MRCVPALIDAHVPATPKEAGGAEDANPVPRAVAAKQTKKALMERECNIYGGMGKRHMGEMG